MREQDPNLISEEDFVAVWGAHVSITGDMFDFTQVHNLPETMVWTIVETDEGDWIAIPGFHIVNKLGYCLTSKPWTHETNPAYWFFDDLTADMESIEVH